MSAHYPITLAVSPAELKELIAAHWRAIADAEQRRDFREVAWRKLRIRVLAEYLKVEA